jgi:hypothetical protein
VIRRYPFDRIGPDGCWIIQEIDGRDLFPGDSPVTKNGGGGRLDRSRGGGSSDPRRRWHVGQGEAEDAVPVVSSVAARASQNDGGRQLERSSGVVFRREIPASLGSARGGKRVRGA